MTTEPTRLPAPIPNQHQRVFAFARVVVERSEHGYDQQPHGWAEGATPCDVPDLDRILREAPDAATRPGAIRVGRTFRGAVLVVVVTGPGWTLAFRPAETGTALMLLGTDSNPDGPVCLRPGRRTADLMALQHTILRLATATETP